MVVFFVFDGNDIANINQLYNRFAVGDITNINH